MGLLSAGLDAARGVLADQWREYFYCPSLGPDILVRKGEKRDTGRGTNKGSDNIISNGSIIAVNEGQCMIIVEQGAVVELCAQPGEFIYDNSTEPSIFYGGLGEGIKESFATFARRFTLGGSTGKDQRVYFFNMKEITGNKYGTANPVPFRVVDRNIGLDIEISLRCHGEYSYRFTDPILFYKNICGNVDYEYKRDGIDSQLKTELLTALQPAFARISDMGIRYYSITAHTQELSAALNEILSEKWGGRYGIKIEAFGVSSVKASEEDEKMIKELQRNAVFRNPNMAAAQIVGAQSSAMQSAASNESAGPIMAFAGMNMAANAGGVNAQSLFAMGQQQNQAPQNNAGQNIADNNQNNASAQGTSANMQGAAPVAMPAASGEAADSNNAFWDCSCGTRNTGKFCMECGKPRPVVQNYSCGKCGWKPKDSGNPPKFCPECGTPFNSSSNV